MRNDAGGNPDFSQKFHRKQNDFPPEREPHGERGLSAATTAQGLMGGRGLSAANVGPCLQPEAGVQLAWRWGAHSLELGYR